MSPEIQEFINSEPVVEGGTPGVLKYHYMERMYYFMAKMADEKCAAAEILVHALEEINREEIAGQRPGGYTSRSAKLSYEALQLWNEKVGRK